MSNLIQELPSLVSSVDTNALNSYKFSFDPITASIMQNNFSTIDRLTIAYDEPKYFKEFGEGLSNPTTISTLLLKLRADKSRNENAIIADYLEKVARTFSLDTSSIDIVKLVWTANIVNSLGDKNPKMEEYLSDLFLSLQFSSAYKDSRITEARAHILEIFENDINPDLAKSYFNVDVEKAQSYLGVAFTTNPEVQDCKKWYDYKTFEEIKDIENVEISNVSDLVEKLKTSSVANYSSAYNFIKTNYLNSTDPTSARYCGDELEKEYKATLILITITKQLGYGEMDKNNQIGFNLLARIENLPKLMAQKNPLLNASNILIGFKNQANIIADEIVHGINAETDDEKEEQAQDGTLDAAAYTKKQLDVFAKVVDKHRLELVGTLSTLVKYRERKANFAKGEENLMSLAKQLGVTLITAEEEPVAKIRYIRNADLLIDIVNKRFDELGRAKEVFKKIRKKMGTSLDIANISFDKAFLGKTAAIASPYIEGLIKSFYKLVDADPKLKSNVKYRRRTPTFTMASMDERVKADNTISAELATVFMSVKLTPSQAAKYEEDKILEEAFEDDIETQI
ncbi:MAG: hypothetical protein J6A28_00285 [Clostridia bacterium]|nr:hypothetical protein [Clostridia bacterium]